MGALGVAKLALKSHLKLKPFFYTLPLNQANTHHALVANIYSLMPGTLSVAIESNRLKLHILDESLFDEELILSLHVKLQVYKKSPNESFLYNLFICFACQYWSSSLLFVAQ